MPPKEEEITAEGKWKAISPANQKKILDNVFCGKCGVTTIVDYTIEDSRSDIVLRGKCAKCGGKVARVIESD